MGYLLRLIAWLQFICTFNLFDSSFHEVGCSYVKSSVKEEFAFEIIEIIMGGKWCLVAS